MSIHVHKKTKFCMSSSVSSAPRKTLLSMDTEKNKPARKRERNLKFRLQCRSSQASSTEGLCFEELSQWSHSLERLIASKYGIKIFQAFLKSEFSDENMEFWLVCEEYKKIRSPFRMTSKAKKIFKCYIQAEAPREINIDHKTREQIRRSLKAGCAGCFDEAQRIVYGLMERDSYPRFLKSDIYRTFLESVSKSVAM
ncbi:regulator of G-protein signaling 13-like [Dunckerocampus dactyliophorus]|uniref:regulator of G-protein signaling 13-like n=1 Tax=Dunckerocampus dactyliophorus TaxID=161453 RepID=UPI002405D33E|nr:regulator of G-protein signaling 13-like [Dunckerocampus dactyliophorus]